LIPCITKSDIAKGFRSKKCRFNCVTSQVTATRGLYHECCISSSITAVTVWKPARGFYFETLFYCKQRGIDAETAIALIVNGFAKEVMNKLPMEFAIEAKKLLAVSLEGSVG